MFTIINTYIYIYMYTYIYVYGLDDGEVLLHDGPDESIVAVGVRLARRERAANVCNKINDN